MTEASNNFDSMTEEYLKLNYVPSIYQKDIYSIDYDDLLNRGIKLLSFDIDETIAGDDDEYPPKSAVTLFANLKNKGFIIKLLTNADDEREKLFSKLLSVDGISKAKKPATDYFTILMKSNSITKDEMAHIGNSIIDDIAGGNASGIYTILVDYCRSNKNMKDEEKQLREVLNKNKLFSEGKYYPIKNKKEDDENA